MNHWDTVAAENRWIADARKLQELRRTDGAGTQDHLSPGANLFDGAIAAVTRTHAALAFEDQRGDVRALADGEVGPLARGLQVLRRRALAQAFPDVDLCHRHAMLGGSAVVRIDRQAHGLRGLDEEVVEGRCLAGHRHLHRAMAPPIFVRSDVGAFKFPEVGKHVLVRPAGAAHALPRVVVGALPAIEDQAVDGTGASEDLAARHIHAPSTQVCVGLRRLAPVHLGRLDHHPATHRGTRPDVAGTPGAGFKAQDLVLSVFAQAGSHHAAARTGADDDEVVRRRWRRLGAAFHGLGRKAHRKICTDFSSVYE
ncbi:hypothetical protein D3C86_1006500 [compost metagenome]